MRDGARTAAAGSRRAFRCFAVALLPLAWGVVGAEQQPPAIMPVRVKTVEGEVTTGKLARFSLADGVALLDAAGRQSTVPADRTVSVEIDRIGPAAHPAGALGVHLTNGDVVFGQIVAGNESSFKILHADLGAIAMPLGRLAAIVTPAGRRERRIPIGTPDARADGDIVNLANGDRLSCLVTRVGPDGVTIASEAGDESTIGFDVLAAVSLAGGADGPAATRTSRAAPGVVMWTTDGSRLTLSSLSWGPGQCTGTAAGGVAFAMPPGHVRRVEIISDAYGWLSDLRPSGIETSGHWGPAWPPVADRNVLGAAMRIGGWEYVHGWGLHARSKLTFDLGGRFKRFTCTAGLDDSAGPLADVDVQVLVDGKRLFSRDGLDRDAKPLRIDVDLAGARKLELVVDYGARGDIQDRFDWADPLLVPAGAGRRK